MSEVRLSCGGDPELSIGDLIDIMDMVGVCPSCVTPPMSCRIKLNGDMNRRYHSNKLKALSQLSDPVEA